jgi:hypothetical protein
MDFRIATTFTESLGRLTGDEQKAVKTSAFDLQLNPTSPGMSFHRLDKAKDKNFWSVYLAYPQDPVACVFAWLTIARVAVNFCVFEQDLVNAEKLSLDPNRQLLAHSRSHYILGRF